MHYKNKKGWIAKSFNHKQSICGKQKVLKGMKAPQIGLRYIKYVTTNPNNKIKDFKIHVFNDL